MTLLEMTISFGILSTVLLAIFGVIRRDTQLAHSTLGIAVAEMQAQQMLRRIEGELADARGAVPVAALTAPLTANETSAIAVDLTLGFPPRGTLLLTRGTGSEERVDYSSITSAQDRFAGLTRGVQCTEANEHNAGAGIDILWASMAQPIELQANPPAALWDGQALEPTGPVFFRGDGSGFSFRVPVDPSGSVPPNYLNGNDLQWGHDVAGVGNVDGWAAFYFQPRNTIQEADTGDDINSDGDIIDVFDVGQIRRLVWDTADSNVPATDLAMGPTNVLQERCNYGGDLDGDGFDDPLFLWMDGTRQLHIRLYILGTAVSGIPIVRRVGSMVFLRNEPEN
ncbi:MAG: type II secretory pathway pseudopilin PulG [Planctomycetota bacterium]|jgi:type II secretory pathway pseudopilin PulG